MRIPSFLNIFRPSNQVRLKGIVTDTNDSPHAGSLWVEINSSEGRHVVVVVMPEDVARRAYEDVVKGDTVRVVAEITPNGLVASSVKAVGGLPRLERDMLPDRQFENRSRDRP